MGVLLKDREGNLVISVYDLSLSVHESLLVSRYLNYGGFQLKASMLEQSSFVSPFSFKSTLLKRSIYFITDTWLFGIDISLQSEIRAIVREASPSHFRVKILPGIDPITH